MVKSENKKSRTIIVLLIALIFILFCVGTALTFVLLNNNAGEQEQAQQGVVFDSNASHYDGTVKDESSSSGIKIPGYADITFTSDSTDFPITLLNPEGNPCNFKFTLSIKETGEELFTSDLVKPGDAISGVKLNNTIAKGEYTLLINISTYNSESGSEMNGAQVKTKLTVE